MTTAKASLTRELRSLATAYQDQANKSRYISDADALERAACAIRLVAVLIRDNLYEREVGLAWLDAGSRILATIQDKAATA